MKNTIRTFAIGDTHGHFKELQDLLLTLKKEANFDPKNDHLVLLGDMVDSGPQVKELLDWAIDFKKQYPDTFHPIYGNHEDLLLDALSKYHPIYGDYYIWWNQGGKETIASYMPDGLSDYEKALVHPENIIPAEHFAFLRSLPRYYEDDKYFYVHGGVYPDKKLSEHDFEDRPTMYNMIWIRDQFIDSPYKWEKKIIFGHSSKTAYIGAGESDFVPIVQDNKIGINTMPRHNMGYLLALELPAEKFYTEKGERVYE